MKTVLIIISMIVIGCDDDRYCNVDGGYKIIPLRIDSSCDKNAVKAIRYAIDELNDWTSQHICQDLVELLPERVEVNHDDLTPPRHTIGCYYEPPEWWGGSTEVLGTALRDQWIKIYWFQEKKWGPYYRIAILLHELGHYVMDNDHLAYPAVMFEYVEKNRLHYTKNDTEHLCSIYECH
jgi:hypothetical protein